MERNEVIKALECCNSTENCNGCPYYKGDEVQHCDKDKDALSLIKELTEENERLRAFPKRLKRRFKGDKDGIYSVYNIHRFIDQIAKEMIGEGND